MSATPTPSDAAPSAPAGERPRESPRDEGALIVELESLLANARRRGLARFTDEELERLPSLYRYAASQLSLHETRGRPTQSLARLRDALARAHELLYRGLDRSNEPLIARIARFFAHDVPRELRAEWKVIALSFAMLYGIAAIAFVAVHGDLELAYSLLTPNAVADEIHQLQATANGEPFRGNFTFGLSASSMTSGFVMANNMWVAILFFASGLVPPLLALLLATNGLMLGTYTGVASHWGQALNISSILWCHGVFELQALVLSGAAGLVLVRAWIAPGPWSRKHAMSLERARAWRLMAPVFPMLFVAGMLEGFVSPHAPLEVRLAIASASAIVLVAWITLGGRERASRSRGE